MPRYNFDRQFFKYFQQLDRKLLSRGLNLGASARGSGSPPGGFVGYLPQNRVSYDIVELESSAGSNSLMDNLNHIRYRLGAIEGTVVGSGGGVNIYEDDVLVASDVTLINFEGGVTVIDEGSNKATIDITGSATDEKIKISANDTTANYLFSKLTNGTGITITEVDDGGDETIEIAYTGITTDELSKVSDNDTTRGYLDGKIIAGTYVTLVQVNDGGDEQLQINCTASGISGPDELIKISSNDTTAEYLGTKIIVGDTLTMDVVSEGLNEQLRIGGVGSARVSSNDTTYGYLDGKLIAGSGIDLTQINEAGDEQLRITCTASGISGTDELIKISANDTNSGYLNGKLIAGSGITLTELDDSGDETLRVDCTVVASGAGSGTFDDILQLTTPVQGDFSWVNQIDATATTSHSKMILYDPANGGVDWHLFVKNAPTAPYIVTIGYIPSLYPTDYSAAGMVLYESSSGYFIHFSLQYRGGVGGPTFSICSMTDTATWDFDYANTLYLPGFFSPMLWLQIEDDSSDRYYRYSLDGYSFRQIYTHAHDTFIAPNKVGFGLASYQSNQKVWSTILHYKEE